jgi:hypothetical protein
VLVLLDAAVYGQYQLGFRECISKCGVLEEVGMGVATATDAKTILGLKVDIIMQR